MIEEGRCEVTSNSGLQTGPRRHSRVLPRSISRSIGTTSLRLCRILETQNYLLRCGVLALPFAPLDSTQSESWGTCNSTRLTFSVRPECNVRLDDGQFVPLQITMRTSAHGQSDPGR